MPRKKPLRVLSKAEWTRFEDLVQKASNIDLQTMFNIVERELRLSDQAIKEGFERS